MVRSRGILSSECRSRATSSRPSRINRVLPPFVSSIVRHSSLERGRPSLDSEPTMTSEIRVVVHRPVAGAASHRHAQHPRIALGHIVFTMPDDLGVASCSICGLQERYKHGRGWRTQFPNEHTSSRSPACLVVYIKASSPSLETSFLLVIHPA